MKTILIVDDDPVIVNILKDKLLRRMRNLNILIALSYKEGVKHILNKKQNIDVALLDLNLPDVESGAIVNFAMKKDIPSIVLTGLDKGDLKEMLMKNNILDYIIKGNKRGIDHAVESAVRLLKNQGKNILLVDDSKVQLAKTTEILEHMKFNVVAASNGIEAYGILHNSNTKFSIVLTDFNMPKMDGMDLTLKIREDFDKDELSVIVLSGNEESELSSRFISVGANDFLTKPYSDIELVTRVNSNLELLELFEKIKDMANKDFMTGSYNRRYFFEVGESIFLKAQNKGKKLSVAMFDIDKFKNINDTYGHDVGDIAIIEVANILNENLRKSDLMARFGGEEFCVLLEDITKKDLENLFEKIRVVFENNIIKINGLKIRFTVSIGIYYGIAESLDEMIKRSDDNLYFCKNNGRNQIAINKY
ncbi:MAG: REC domain-containing diguanylate cyclase [Arcobacter sp.]|nr:MAG: REC domain-containing diguanylate cyclase [Arcobacter sp.]